MRFILDGDREYSESARLFDDMFTEIERAEAFLNPLDRAHKKLVKRIAKQYAKALSTFCASLNDQLKKVGHLIQPQVHDSARLDATRALSPHTDKNGYHVWPILITLGWFPRVIGLANRLVVADRFAGEGDPFVNHVFKDWDPISRPLSVLTVCFDDKDGIERATEKLTLDTMVLVFLHELAHVLEGHLFYEDESNDERRAIEADADFRAGFWCCEWLARFAEALEAPKPQSLEDSFRRLSRAAFLFSILLHAFSKNKADYHLPPTRARIVLDGAVVASGFATSSAQREQAAKAFFEETYFMSMGFLQAGQEQFINWNDAQSNTDFELFKEVTLPILQRLRYKRMLRSDKKDEGNV